MDFTAKENLLDRQGETRRRFMIQVAATGAVAGAAALPALAQEELTQSSDAPAASAQNSIAEILARYATTLKYEELPPELVRLAKRFMIDSIGCAFGGYSAEPSQIAIKQAAGISAVRSATVMCSGIKTSTDRAVFANGVMIRYLDFNDGYISLSNGHPSDSIAALLSAAEVAGGSGRDLILATVLAYEVFCKLIDVMDLRTAGMDSVTIAGVAGVVGASRLLGLTQPQMVHAISIYVAGNTAVNQTRRGTLSSWKGCAAGEACRKAIFAAELAQSGMSGPGQVFEGREGLFHLIKAKPVKLPALGGGNAPFGMSHASTKRFALGQYAQTAAQAAAEARQFFTDAGEIQEIILRVSGNAIKTMAGGPEKWRPQTRETADHSLPYATAVVLKYGKIDESFYDDQYIFDPKLIELVSRVRCIQFDEADRRQKETNLCELELMLKSGQRKTVRVDYHRGHWKNPMTDAETDEKFRAMAQKHLPAAKIDSLLRQLWTLENLPKVATLMEMTRV